MIKQEREKLFKFRMLIKKQNNETLEALRDVLISDWQLVLIKLELNRRNNTIPSKEI